MGEILNTFIQGNCKEKLKLIPRKSVRCCVTSPPYFGLRDYGTGVWLGGDESCSHFKESKGAKANTGQKNDMGGCGDSIYKAVCPKCGAARIDEQIGLEETPEEYIANLVGIFEEVKQVLTDDGTLWVNIGDSYAGSGKGNNPDGTPHPSKLSAKQGTQQGTSEGIQLPNKASAIGLKPKDLIGIPWMLAFALRAAGWYLRQDIIWHKPNPMPESVTDRCTKAHEYIFLLSKSNKYYYDADAIKTVVQDSTVQRMLQQIENQKGSDRVPGKTNGTMKAVGPGRAPRPGIDVNGGNQGSDNGIPAIGHKNLLRTDKNHSFHEARKGSGIDNSAALNGNGVKGHSGNFSADGELIGGGMANKKSVWTIVTQPYSEAHFATFPPQLIVDCIKAGSAEGDTILDPFSGAGTTAMVAQKLERNFIAIELNQKYIDIAERRLTKELGMFRGLKAQRNTAERSVANQAQ